MSIFEQLQRLQQMQKLIAAEQTGPPIDFARKLNISTRRLYDILDELKSRGAPIVYSHIAKTYIYSEVFQLDISCDFRHLSPAEQENISGGWLLFSTACFMQRIRLSLLSFREVTSYGFI